MNALIIREIYVLSSNDSTKFADWVTKNTIGPSQRRNWKADPLLAEEEPLEPDDYQDAHAELGTDRGHLVPLASFSGTEHWRETKRHSEAASIGAYGRNWKLLFEPWPKVKTYQVSL